MSDMIQVKLSNSGNQKKQFLFLKSVISLNWGGIFMCSLKGYGEAGLKGGRG